MKVRYFYAGHQTFGIILYLLSPYKRKLLREDKNGATEASVTGRTRILIQYVSHFYGFKSLHPETWLIGFVLSKHVTTIARNYLSSITHDIFHKYCIPQHMECLYKSSGINDSCHFEDAWQEFMIGMRDIYAMAAKYNNEAAIACID
jgi:hypothetical protein